jgi:hypothetical protein
LAGGHGQGLIEKAARALPGKKLGRQLLAVGYRVVLAREQRSLVQGPRSAKALVLPAGRVKKTQRYTVAAGAAQGDEDLEIGLGQGGCTSWLPESKKICVWP